MKSLEFKIILVSFVIAMFSMLTFTGMSIPKNNEIKYSRKKSLNSHEIKKSTSPYTTSSQHFVSPVTKNINPKENDITAYNNQNQKDRNQNNLELKDKKENTPKNKTNFKSKNNDKKQVSTQDTKSQKDANKLEENENPEPDETSEKKEERIVEDKNTPQALSKETSKDMNSKKKSEHEEGLPKDMKIQLIQYPNGMYLEINVGKKNDNEKYYLRREPEFLRVDEVELKLVNNKATFLDEDVILNAEYEYKIFMEKHNQKKLLKTYDCIYGRAKSNIEKNKNTEIQFFTLLYEVPKKALSKNIDVTISPIISKPDRYYEYIVNYDEIGYDFVCSSYPKLVKDINIYIQWNGTEKLPKMSKKLEQKNGNHRIISTLPEENEICVSYNYLPTSILYSDIFKVIFDSSSAGPSIEDLIPQKISEKPFDVFQTTNSVLLFFFEKSNLQKIRLYRTPAFKEMKYIQVYSNRLLNYEDKEVEEGVDYVYTIKQVDLSTGDEKETGDEYKLNFGKYSDTLEKDLDHFIIFRGTKLFISQKSVVDEIALNINSKKEVPQLEKILTNVTAKETIGYEYLPHNTKFNKNILISVEYDETLLPQGKTTEDIYSFYYNTEENKWIKLDRISVDTDNRMIISQIDHFTDIINGVLSQEPEHPELANNDINTIKGIKGGDPTDGITIIQPPSANNRGTANLSYPIMLPPGRQGIQPQLSLNYNSGGGDGLLGKGWDLSIPCIEVDIKNGTPQNFQSDPNIKYLLNGEELVRTSISKTNSTTGDIGEVYVKRVEGDFSEIIRWRKNFNNEPDDHYFWTVKLKSGIEYRYGEYLIDINSYFVRQFINNPILSSYNIIHYNTIDPSNVSSTISIDSKCNGFIYKWYLSEVEDLQGNYYQYFYDRYTISASNSEPWTQTYLNCIRYTGYSDPNSSEIESPKYYVEFEYDNQARQKTPIFAKCGFKVLTDRLLKRIYVTYRPETEIQLRTRLRAYEFDYLDNNGNPGPLSTDLLFGIKEYGAVPKIDKMNAISSTELFFKHRFEYTTFSISGNKVEDAFTWKNDIQLPIIAYNTSSTGSNVFADLIQGLLNPLASSIRQDSPSTYTASGAVTLGTKFSIFLIFVLNIEDGIQKTAGGSKNTLGWYDINGDGLIDHVYKDVDGNGGSNSEFLYCPNKGYINSTNSLFEHVVKIDIGNIQQNYQFTPNLPDLSLGCGGIINYIFWIFPPSAAVLSLGADFVKDNASTGLTTQKEYSETLSGGFQLNFNDFVPMGAINEGNSSTKGHTEETSGMIDFNGDGFIDVYNVNFTNSFGINGYTNVNLHNGLPDAVINLTANQNNFCPDGNYPNVNILLNPISSESPDPSPNPNLISPEENYSPNQIPMSPTNCRNKLKFIAPFSGLMFLKVYNNDRHYSDLPEIFPFYLPQERSRLSLEIRQELPKLVNNTKMLYCPTDHYGSYYLNGNDIMFWVMRGSIVEFFITEETFIFCSNYMNKRDLLADPSQIQVKLGYAELYNDSFEISGTDFVYHREYSNFLFTNTNSATEVNKNICNYDGPILAVTYDDGLFHNLYQYPLSGTTLAFDLDGQYYDCNDLLFWKKFFPHRSLVNLKDSSWYFLWCNYHPGGWFLPDNFNVYNNIKGSNSYINTYKGDDDLFFPPLRAFHLNDRDWQGEVIGWYTRTSSPMNWLTTGTDGFSDSIGNFANSSLGRYYNGIKDYMFTGTNFIPTKVLIILVHIV